MKMKILKKWTEEESVLSTFSFLGDRTIKIVQDAHLLASLVTTRGVFYDENNDNINDDDWGKVVKIWDGTNEDFTIRRVKFA